MIVGRGHREYEQGHGSGISIGGNSVAPLQNVVGQDISHVYQSTSAQGAVDAETVRSLLVSFRSDVDRAENLGNVTILRAMTDTVDGAIAEPDLQVQASTLRGIAQALPALVAGTVVQQGGEALANAIGGWIG
ncbi:hypothetical protein [Streptomyces sp. NPDC001876]|uniref:hypothetical protein n=1 Tax=Streptomyces sp. NPDC001876 TaxID=3154402 RepID=UPI00331E42A9